LPGLYGLFLEKNKFFNITGFSPKNGAKEFYETIVGTPLAQAAFAEGYQISPSSGWHIYTLSHETPGLN